MRGPWETNGTWHVRCDDSTWTVAAHRSTEQSEGRKHPSRLQHCRCRRTLPTAYTHALAPSEPAFAWRSSPAWPWQCWNYIPIENCESQWSAQLPDVSADRFSQASERPSTKSEGGEASVKLSFNANDKPNKKRLPLTSCWYVPSHSYITQLTTKTDIHKVFNHYPLLIDPAKLALPSLPSYVEIV